MSSANLDTAVALILGAARCKAEGWGICTSFGPLLPSEECFESKRGMVSLQKSEASQRISERRCFLMFGPATVVEFRSKCIGETFQLRNQYKIMQVDQIPTK